MLTDGWELHIPNTDRSAGGPPALVDGTSQFLTPPTAGDTVCPGAGMSEVLSFDAASCLETNAPASRPRSGADAARSPPRATARQAHSREVTATGLQYLASKQQRGGRRSGTIRCRPNMPTDHSSSSQNPLGRAIQGGGPDGLSPAGLSGFSSLIDPACVIRESEGCVRLSLSASAHTWFRFLAQLTDAIHLTRTPAAVLGIHGAPPDLAGAENPVLPRSERGCFCPNLAEHASLWAVREVYPGGPLYFLEVRDARGWAAQRIVIPPGRARVLFQEFVCAHQSPVHQHRPWFPPNHAASARRVASVGSRIPWLRRRSRQGVPEVRPLDLNRVIELLASAVQSRQPLRTRVYNRSLIVSSRWTPEVGLPAQPAMDAASPAVSRFFGEGVALEMHHHPAATAWLWMGICSCCGEEKWAVEIGDADEALALSLTAADDLQEADWRTFLESCRLA